MVRPPEIYDTPEHDELYNRFYEEWGKLYAAASDAMKSVLASSRLVMWSHYLMIHTSKEQNTGGE